MKVISTKVTILPTLKMMKIKTGMNLTMKLSD